MSRLVDHALKQAEGVPLRLDDIKGQEVTILAVEFSSGSFGNYAVMRVEDANGEQFDCMTGAKLVMDALENTALMVNSEGESIGFPCLAIFLQKGRTWIME